MNAKKCDRCGKFYESTRENVHQHVQGEETFPVNSVRIGFWEQRHRCWRNIASAYDLCPECAKEITDVIMGGKSQMKMHMRKSNATTNEDLADRDDGK